MPQQDKNKGNRNAALPSGQRAKVNFTVSLSRERLNKFIKYLQVTAMDDSNVTSETIAEQARQMLYEWIDNLKI